MLAPEQFPQIRRARSHEAGLVAYLRLASLICLEMPGYPLAAVHEVMRRLPDADDGLVAVGRYLVEESGGDLVGGAGWSVMPLRFPRDRLMAESGAAASLLSADAVLVRGFFLDPDRGRSGTGARILSHIEADAARAGYAAAEMLIPATAQGYYRGLGFRRTGKFWLTQDRGDPLPVLQMRKGFAARLAAAA